MRCLQVAPVGWSQIGGFEKLKPCYLGMAGADRRAVRSKLLVETRAFSGVLSSQVGAVRSCGAILGHRSAGIPECCGNIRDKQLIRPEPSGSSVLEPTEPKPVLVRGPWVRGSGPWVHNYRALGNCFF